MTQEEGIGLGRAKAQREALAGLREILVGYGVRCLIVDRVRLVMNVKYGARTYLPPYMEIRDGSRLLATVAVSERIGRKPCFTVTRPGIDPAPTDKAQDVKATAEQILAGVMGSDHEYP